MHRTLETQLKEAASRYPVVTVTGPRQSGKTTLVRAAFDEHRYLNLEAPDIRQLAQDDPRGFLSQFSGSLVLDEVQRVPELFSYIQVLVDEDPRPGRFILTGSQNFLLMDSVSQTLAGRCSVQHLMPLSLDELLQRPSFSPERLGESFPRGRTAPPDDVLAVLHGGFFPRIHDQGLDPRNWLANYYETYLQRDVRALANIGDLRTFSRFVALCAGRNGQLLNQSSLAVEAGISHTTVGRWLSVLEASFQILLLPPYHRNFNKRIVKSPKLHFLDTGLLCFLLRIRTSEELFAHSARGGIFESFVVSELHKRLLHAGNRADLYFWRDSRGREVDVVMAFGSTMTALECKSGQTITGDFFKGTDYLQSLASGEKTRAAVVYGGDEALRHGSTVVYPWWNF